MPARHGKGMIGGKMGTGMAVTGTSGGDAGASGLRRKLALAMAAIFLSVLALITIGNAESMISDFAAAGVHETVAHIWIWQVTSVLAWLCVTVLVWWTVARCRPPRFSWPMTAILFAIGLPVASGLHIALMIALRSLVYVLESSHYTFEGSIANPYLYEFRKDIPTYLQFVTLAAMCQWLLARACAAMPKGDVPQGLYLAVGDGAVTHQVPISDIVQVAAAGNYVEIEVAGRTLLNRATLATIEAELGARFVRIHRSRLINRDAIRRIETNQSGDFEVILADGRRIKGSRRYRAVSKSVFEP